MASPPHSSASDDPELFPVVLAAPKRVRLIKRDDTDVWAPSIEDINRGTYDALKLKRVSFYLDVGLPYGNAMGFGFDGTLIVPRNPHLRCVDDGLDEFNRVIATCLLGGLPGDQVTPDQLAFGVLSSRGYFRYEHPHGAVSRLHQAFGQGAAGSYLSIDLMSPPWTTRGEIEAAFRAGKPVIDNLPNLNAASLVMAVSYFRSGEHRNSLIYGWTLIEQLIDDLFHDAFGTASEALLFEERAKGVRSLGRTTAAKIELLAQALVLDRRLYVQLAQVRSSRNDFIHESRRPTSSAASACIKVLSRLIQVTCDRRGVSFDGKRLSGAVQHRPLQGPYIARAGDVDWPDVGWWHPVSPIPGEDRWEGEYEDIRDIQIERREPPLECNQAAKEKKQGKPRTRSK